ncbi:hypothetical protein GVAV_002865 [Gurleya vavrai]
MQNDKKDVSLRKIDFNSEDYNAETYMQRVIEKQLDPSIPYPINIFEIKNFCYYGFSTNKLRPKCWKLFLGYFHKNKFKHANFVKERRKCYLEYCEKAKTEAEINPRIYDVLHDDVDRTFVMPVYITKDNQEYKKCKFLDQSASLLDAALTNRKIIKRILLTYKITNASVGYVQGMVSLLLPIYYTLKNDFDKEEVENAEADAFFCFFYLMTEAGENFVESMDNDKSIGIKNKMKKVFDIIEIMEPKLFLRMKQINLIKYPFHFRWISLLLAQEFKIDEVIWLWDRILSDSKRFEIVLFCCACIIIYHKEFILKNDFDACMEILQKENLIKPEELFTAADLLRRKYYDINN